MLNQTSTNDPSMQQHDWPLMSPREPTSHLCLLNVFIASDELLAVFLICKSLWIKASAKCDA